jgi:kynurenine formamidase
VRRRRPPRAARGRRGGAARRAFERGDILLCLTDNSAKWAAPSFQKDFTFVTKDAADVLVDRGVRALGMDYLSIEEFGSPDFRCTIACSARASSSSRASTSAR